MKTYFKIKIVEFSILFVSVFFAMSQYFQVMMGNSISISSESSLYIKYTLFLFSLYIVVSIKNRIDYISYFKKNGHTPYKEFESFSKFTIIIHKYLPLFILVILSISQNNFGDFSFYYIFYSCLAAMIILFSIAIRFSLNAVKIIDQTIQE